MYIPPRALRPFWMTSENDENASHFCFRNSEKERAYKFVIRHLFFYKHFLQIQWYPWSLQSGVQVRPHSWGILLLDCISWSQVCGLNTLWVIMDNARVRWVSATKKASFSCSRGVIVIHSRPEVSRCWHPAQLFFILLPPQIQSKEEKEVYYFESFL